MFLTIAKMRTGLISAGHFPPKSDPEIKAAYMQMAMIQELYGLGIELPDTIEAAFALWRAEVARN